MNNRILIFSSSSSPIGGVETWLDRCCQFLKEVGMEPIVGLARGQKFNNPERFLRFHPQLKTIEVDGRGLNSEGRIRALMRCIRQVKPAIVLPMSLMESNDAVIRCKQQGDDVRLVVHAQGNLAEMLADLKHYQAAIDHVVCPGRLTRNLLTTWGQFDESRVTHIPNGADKPTHSWPPRNGPLRLGYIGRFTRGDKRVTDLVPLCEALTRRQMDFHLTIVGDGPAKEELIERLGSFQNVSMPGPMSHEELYSKIFPSLDALVLCSSSEAFGIVLAEAMMHGVVPVTSQYLGFYSEKLVVHDQTGLSFRIGDMDNAADQVERLINEPELQERLSVACRQHAINNYTWQRSLTGWHELLDAISKQPAVDVPTTYRAKPLLNPGRLDSLQIPGAVSDFVRRARRFLFGSAVPDGGEEWPLFRRDYTAEVLNEINEYCKSLEQSANVKISVD